MVHFGLQAITSGANPMAVKRGLEKTAEFLTLKLKENAKPIKGREDIRVSMVHAWKQAGTLGQRTPSSVPGWRIDKTATACSC